MALKFIIVFLICLTVSVVVESSPRKRIDAKNEGISEFNTKNAIQRQNRENRQLNYIYYPYNGYQSYYVNSIQRPTKQPHRRSTTTQRYSIWQLSRKRRSPGSDSETGDTEVSQQKFSNDIRQKRQIDGSDVDYDFYPYNLPQSLGRRQHYAEPRYQPYSMWDLTRRKRNVLDKINKSKLY